jgi:hypothetical protein
VYQWQSVQCSQCIHSPMRISYPFSSLQNAHSNPGPGWVCCSMGQRRLGLKHTSHFFLVSRSGIIGCLHLLPLCAFLVCKGAALPYLPLKQYDSLLFSRLLFE